MLEKRVVELLDAAFEERPDLFLIDLDISTGNVIKVIVDGDQDVKVSDCIFVSRAVEHQLDREEQDFSLEVTSAGVGKPLKNYRQFVKNIGRTLEITDREKTKETGVLESADKDQVTITWKAREPKPVGKGKVTVEKKWSIAYEDIKQAKVVITFN
ncbi:ribosome assembly cofactor RimP [Nonlabens marinus]|uniref:Ribosome maturation factor RimP n=1 Tax=Nonlabens marinus S1-08 TaxID=1454201 RepID=W8VWW6_9FLAO|nr:ribosome assembly cofactor RimP [Nonlabens marinus]BAO55122.1 clustered with transcription termination protein NusA [Nonlabens marinus S1-08]